MNELIEAIRAAVADGATAEQKAVAAQACRTILAALGAEPGKPIVFPGTPEPQALSRLSLDQVLDLLIARLSAVANASEPPQAQGAPAPARGIRIAMAPSAAQPAARVSQPNATKPPRR